MSLFSELLPALRHLHDISPALFLAKIHSSLYENFKRRPDYFRSLVTSPLFLNVGATSAIFSNLKQEFGIPLVTVVFYAKK